MDGVDYRGLDADWLREKVSVVHQDPVLFGMSIAANITYPSDTATQAQVEAAARFADAHDFILSLPDGYQAVLGDTGVRLTAPQKLQVALARAMIADGKVLILDETLHGMLPATAQVVLNNLQRERGSRTVVALSAFPSSLGSAPDSVCVLDDGKVVEEGPEADLLRRRGRYWQLMNGSDARVPEERGSDDEASVWQQRLALADTLEDQILMLKMPQNKMMELVETAAELKEALVLEAQQ